MNFQTNFKPSDLGGGLFNGFSPIQSSNGYNDAETINNRRILTRAWNKKGAMGIDRGFKRRLNSFRIINNAGDFLMRENYVCGGNNIVNQTQSGRVMRRTGGRPQNNCDGTGVEASNCNPKFVYDSSDYVRFLKQKAINKSYNDLSYGGDQSNASYTAIRGVIGGKRSSVP